MLGIWYRIKRFRRTELCKVPVYRHMTDRSIGFSWKLSNVSTDNINDIDQGIAVGSLRVGVAVRGFTSEKGPTQWEW